MNEAARHRLSSDEAPTLDAVVGRNIREERHRRGITAEDVEDRCAEYGVLMTRRVLDE